MFGPELSRWQLPLCAVSTRSWRFRRARRVRTQLHAQVPTQVLHIYVRPERRTWKRAPNLRANESNYAPDAPSPLALSHRLLEHLISGLVCAQTYKQTHPTHVYAPCIFKYTNSHSSYEHVRKQACRDTNTEINRNKRTFVQSLFVFPKNQHIRPSYAEIRHICLCRLERTLSPVDRLPTGYKDATSCHEKSCSFQSSCLVSESACR